MDGDKNIESNKLRDEVLDMKRTAFAALDKKMENAKKIAAGLTNTKGMHYKPQAVYEILQERKNIIEKAFLQSISNFFTSINEGEFVMKSNADLNNLKVIIQTLKHELGLLNQKLDLFEMLGMTEISNGLHVSETSCAKRQNGNQDCDMRLGLLSIKLEIIKHYLVFAPNSCTVQISYPKASSESEAGNVARTVKELARENIIKLMLERRNCFEQAKENNSDKSLIELMGELDKDESFRVIWKNTFERLKRLIILLGTRLSLCVSEFLFVAAMESESAVRQYQNCFKFLIKLLVELKNEISSIAIRRVLFVLELAEKELVKIRVLKQELLDDDDQNGNEDVYFKPKQMSPREAEFDLVLNLLVKHVSWFESALSNPFSLGLHLEDDFTACYVEMEDTRKKVQILKGEKGERVEVVMTQFRQVMELKIAEKWAKLEE